MQIDQKNLSKLFTDMQRRHFVIPDYQRPYNWNTEKCEILWEDLKDNFFEAPNTDYFLGTIVTCKNGNDLEVIDGQQRLTTFSLLLRAFYTKLESMLPETDEIRGLKTQIEPCLWDVDEVTLKVTDKTKTRIKTEVATEKDKDSFDTIMITGSLLEQKDNNYSKNYAYFRDQCDIFAQQNPMEWYRFCNYILKRCVLLPIECQNENVALTIFSTLNNRGMPLSDADIFKSELYKASSQKDEFVDLWNTLSEICESTKDKKGNYEFTIDDVFMYYMQVLRARDGDKDTSNTGLRTYYLQNKKEKLLQEPLMSEVLELAEFWRSANGFDGKYNMPAQTMKWMHCLWAFPNTIWIYPVSAYFLTNKEIHEHWETAETQERLSEFLRKLCAFVYAKYIYAPSLSGIKGTIYALDIDICKTGDLPVLDTSFIDDTIEYEMDKLISAKPFVRGILTIDAYLNPNQEYLLANPEQLEIEHILPQKWQDTNYNGWDKTSAAEYIEKLGNKVLFEKKLNILAGNGYFAQKKEKYKNSSIANVQDLAKVDQSDWSREELLKRDEELKIRVINFFKSI